MLNAIGLVIILLCVFGSFLLSGGNLGVILHALPHEMLAIAGAAVGAFILGNSLATVKKAWKGTVRVFKGVRWTEADFRDLLALLYTLLSTFRKDGANAIEKHLDQPEESSIFNRYPKLLKDQGLIDRIVLPRCQRVERGQQVAVKLGLRSILSSFSVRRLPPIAPPKRVRRTERGADIGPSTRYPVFCFSRVYEEMTSSFQIWAAYAVALS